MIFCLCLCLFLICEKYSENVSDGRMEYGIYKQSCNEKKRTYALRSTAIDEDVQRKMTTVLTCGTRVWAGNVLE